MDNEVNFSDKPQPPAGESGASENGPANEQRPNGGPKKFWKRRRKFRPQGGAQNAGANPSAPNGGGQQNRRFQQNPRRSSNQRGGGGQPRGITGPMDHAYREPNGNASNGNGASNNAGAGNGGGFRFQRNGRSNNQRSGGGGGRFGRNFPPQQSAAQKQNTFSYDAIQPVVSNGEDLGTRIYLFVDDLFFVTKINETARKLQIKVAFVKTMDELLAKVEEQGGVAPKLVVVDLGALSGKPITVIPKVKSKFKKETSILGFVPHAAGELKLKAQEAGCDAVMPRSAFSSNLPNILRRYATDELRDQEEC